MSVADARVVIWGSQIGAVSWIESREIGVFQYAPDFIESGIELAPLQMPLASHPYEFPALAKNTFKGLPGMLADSIPDKFGNAIIDAWLTSQGRTAEEFHPVERLCYLGNRGMGALEFQPATLGAPGSSGPIEVEALVLLAGKVLQERESLQGVFSAEDDRTAIEDILRVGASAGGARAKAVLVWNPDTNEFRSGQSSGKTERGFEHWLIKFDGVSNNKDIEIADPLGYGKIEYAYYLMACEAGLEMNLCRLHHEGARSHFMTRRFDRDNQGQKQHMQSLGAMAHFDFNLAGANSYEQSIRVIKQLQLPVKDVEQQILRAFFNVVARNQDDHVKNIAFLMNKSGEWRLTPAYDITYSWQPEGAWTNRHQMTLNGKGDQFTKDDLKAFGLTANMKAPKSMKLLDRIVAAVERWPEFAEKADVPEKQIERIKKAHRLKW